MRRDKPEVLNILIRELNKGSTELGRLPMHTIARLLLRKCTAHLEKLVCNEFAVDDYTIVQRINKVTKRSAHLVMAEKMSERTDMPILRGDSVSYAHIVDPTKSKATERVEAPVIIKQKPEIQIDRSYYMSHKVCGIVRSTIELYVPPEVVDTMFDVYQFAVDRPGYQTIDELSGKYPDGASYRKARVEAALDLAIQQNRIPHAGWFPEERGKKRKVKPTPEELEAERKANRKVFSHYLRTSVDKFAETMVGGKTLRPNVTKKPLKKSVSFPNPKQPTLTDMLRRI